jgi:hypothetical protein
MFSVFPAIMQSIDMRPLAKKKKVLCESVRQEEKKHQETSVL